MARPTSERPTETDAETTGGGRRPRRERRYEQLLGCVRANTGGPESDLCRAGVRREQLYLSLAAHGPYDHQELSRSIQAALSNGDLVEWTDGDGAGRLTRATVPALQAVVAEHREQDDPPREQIEQRIVPALRGVGDDA